MKFVYFPTGFPLDGGLIEIEEIQSCSIATPDKSSRWRLLIRRSTLHRGSLTRDKKFVLRNGSLIVHIGQTFVASGLSRAGGNRSSYFYTSDRTEKAQQQYDCYCCRGGYAAPVEYRFATENNSAGRKLNSATLKYLHRLNRVFADVQPREGSRSSAQMKR